MHQQGLRAVQRPRLCSRSIWGHSKRNGVQPDSPLQTGHRAGIRAGVVCHALESYIVDKLKASEQTYKEMQLRMADPEVGAICECTQRTCVRVCLHEHFARVNDRFKCVVNTHFLYVGVGAH